MIGAVLCFFGKHAWRREFLFNSLAINGKPGAPQCYRCRRCRAVRDA